MYLAFLYKQKTIIFQSASLAGTDFRLKLLCETTNSSRPAALISVPYFIPTIACFFGYLAISVRPAGETAEEENHSCRQFFQVESFFGYYPVNRPRIELCESGRPLTGTGLSREEMDGSHESRYLGHPRGRRAEETDWEIETETRTIWRTGRFGKPDLPACQNFLHDKTESDALKMKYSHFRCCEQKRKAITGLCENLAFAGV